MAGPGQYVADVTEGITRVEDLPKPKIVRCSRMSMTWPGSRNNMAVNLYSGAMSIPET